MTQQAVEAIDRAGLRNYMGPLDSFWESSRNYINENRYEEEI
jgi:hypothetical protein